METVSTTHPSTFGALLRRHRLACDLTQEQLAERASLSVRGISDLERGAKKTPRRDTVDLLVAALGLTPHQRAIFESAARLSGPRAATLHLSVPDQDGQRSIPGRPVDDLGGRPVLVGRSRELALLQRHLSGEGPPVLLFAGEPGMGKSRLLRETALLARGQGWRVLEGGCQRRGGQEPYAPLLTALERHLRQQTQAQQRISLQGCAWLVRLLPELADAPIEALPDWTVPLAQERRLLFAAVRRYLSNAAGPSGVLLVLDDMQWADPDALELLLVLARSAEEVSLRIVGAYRDTEVHPRDPLSGALSDLAHAGLVVHHTLAPLSVDDADHLLAEVLDGDEPAEPALRERMLRRAGGVPFFVVSCAQGFKDGVSQALPWDLTQSIRQRVAVLPDVAQDVLGVVAILGRRVERSVLLAVLARPEEVVLSALESACRGRLLEEDGPAGYRLAHDVIREVVEADLGAGRRTAVHRRVAAALEEAEAGTVAVEVLAYHYARSDAFEKAVTYLERAGDHNRGVGAHAAAEGYYRELVDRLEGRLRQREAARALEKLGGVLATAARYDAALEALERAIATYRTMSDSESIGRVSARIGHVHAARGTPWEGVQRLELLLEPLAAGGQSPGLAAVHAALAQLYFVSGRYAEQLAAAEQAADLARALGDNRLLSEAEGKRGVALIMVGRIAQALDVYEKLLAPADAAGDLATLINALNNIAHIYMTAGDLDTSRHYNDRARELATWYGDPALLVIVIHVRSGIAFQRGDWQQACVDCEQAVAISQEIGASHVSAYALGGLGRLRLLTGAWEEGRRLLTDGLALAREAGNLQTRRALEGMLAECDVLAGNPHAARARLIPLLDRPGLEESNVTPLLPLLAEAHLDLGEVIPAAEVAARATRRARSMNNRLDLVAALRVQALVAARQGRWEEAVSRFAEGLDVAQSIPLPYGAARLQYSYGLLQAHRGERDAARLRLEAALTVFQRLGARGDIERVEQALAAVV